MQSSDLHLANPSPSSGLARLIASIPGPWHGARHGRSFTWTAQALSDPSPTLPLRLTLDERGGLQLGDHPTDRKAPVHRQQLTVFLLQWAQQRVLQWQRLLSCVPGLSTDVSLDALRHHETQTALRLAERVWSASLNGKLETGPVGRSSANVLLRWVLGARDSQEYRRRRVLALRYRPLLAMAYPYRSRMRRAWPWRLRRASEDEVLRFIRPLGLPSWARDRICSQRQRDTFLELPPDRQLLAWKRLSEQLPQRLWPKGTDELRAAEAVLAHLSPLFCIGKPVDDFSTQPGDERRLRWVLGQLHQQHDSSWARLLEALQQDAPLTALMHGTLPRLREVLNIVHEGDAQVLEIFTSPLRAWSPGRWRVALQDWHHRTLGGHPGPRLGWNGLLADTVSRDGFAFSSPVLWDELRQLLEVVASPDWQSLLTDLLRGSAQFVEVRCADSAQLVALAALTTAPPAAGNPDTNWPRAVELRFAPGLDSQKRAAVHTALTTLLTHHPGLDWPLLHWRQNWESALREPELAKRLACSFLKTWQLTAP